MKKDKLKEYLIELNFDNDFIDEVISYVDNEKDIEVLYEKIKFLNKHGIDQNILDTILSENPLFLTSPLETVKNSVNFLKNIKIDDIPNVLEINSELLSTSDKTMSENYKLLKILIPDEKELLRLLKIDAEILSFNTDYLERRFEFFIKNGLKDNIKDIILNHIEAFEDEEDEIDLELLK